MSWPVGTWLVCVESFARGDAYAHEAPPRFPQRGEYFISAGAVSPRHLDGPSVELMEIRGYAFLSDRFKPAESTHSEAGTVRQQEPVAK